ncbi:hypothetical protein AVEN_234075-1 [Araneus ventricosus]|uniref:Uncharacterized protein n=1 Tax=Araneus ventricosus TaxID=182803 RepID=A0A4Y2UTW3_ARAVE|nr:hypothetical protein AVEN_45318-1 [Araneus ventricosus]GBO15070.1 hypothetical protein AVEN_222573-1 [Araneus ventricosus]GBO15099.1 hypothetical protein AVEN_39852-1 [Araneus ventricosus]GBO15333.1 hypothetical protein AVEN_234075-1 [Araneus ventricosus]
MISSSLTLPVATLGQPDSSACGRSGHFCVCFRIKGYEAHSTRALPIGQYVNTPGISNNQGNLNYFPAVGVNACSTTCKCNWRTVIDFIDTMNWSQCMLNFLHRN